MNKLLFVCAILLFMTGGRVQADNDIQGQPAPQSADELLTSFDRGLEGQPAVETAIHEILEKSELKLKLRNYYLNRTRPENSDPLAWAQGGSLEYKVDKVAGYFGLNAEFFGSYKLHAPEERDGTLLLESGQNSINSLGVLNPKATYQGNILSLYRQKIDLPYVNSQDNRMVPNTFEGYLVGMPRAENENFQYVAGYIDSMKKRNEDDFHSMSDAAGVRSVDRGMVFAGTRYYFTPDFSVGAVDYYVDDILNISYLEGVHKLKFSEKLANAASFQLSDQRSTGDDLLRDEDFSTNFWGIQDAISYNYVTLKAAFTSNDSGGDLRSPYGSYPGYNSSIVEDFNRADEDAWQVGLAYNFARLGLKELGLSSAYIQGNGAVNESTKANLPDKNETDVTLDYKVDKGVLEGFWVRLRSAFIHEDGVGTTKDYRIIVNYEIPLYKPS